MNLLVGPYTSEYGASSCEYGGHQSTSDMGGITQLEYTQQAPTHDLGDTINYHYYGGDTQPTQDPGDLTQERGIEGASQQEQPPQEESRERSSNFMRRLSGAFYVRRSKRENRGKPPDPVYRT